MQTKTLQHGPAPGASTVRVDLLTLRSAVAQAGQSMMLPTFARQALAASLRLIEAHEQELQELRAEVAKLRGASSCGLKPGAY